MIRSHVFTRRPWLFTRRYYYNNWRIPGLAWSQLGRGRSVSYQLSYRAQAWHWFRALLDRRP
jgi:hypothetical protein